MKKFCTWLSLLILAFILTACSSGDSNAVLKIGVLPDVDSIPLIVAANNGYFKDAGVDVEIQHFKSAQERDSALQSGKIDGAVSDVLAAAFAKDGGFEVSITSMTNGSYKLLVNKDAGAASVADLKGKDVAISTNTIIEYTTDRMLEKAGLKDTDVNKVAIPQIPTRLEMLQNGKVAAATLPDPLATEAVKNGAKLLDSSDRLGINPGVMIFTADSIKKNSKGIEAMYKAYNRAVEYLNNQPVTEYIDIIIKDAGFPEDIKGSMQLPSYTEAGLPSKEDVDSVMEWLTGKKLIKEGFSYDELVEDKFVR
ncbi:MAG: MetQ/NlpA family ABC transporter substrate-binding protein [Thermoanaerobacteraceae bacterium]|nr:MetQ/NlpA family ABC transporter substrate-binding protein [Thermoanaerobacteraceae bacterium]